MYYLVKEHHLYSGELKAIANSQFQRIFCLNQILYKVSLPKTRYLYLRWPFFFMKQSNINSFNLSFSLECGILYIYFPCLREIWRFVHPRIFIFHEDSSRGKYDFSYRGWTNLHISRDQGKWMFYSTAYALFTFWISNISLNTIFFLSACFYY